MSFIVNNTTFPNPLDLIAPHNCRGCGRLGSPLCEKCKNYIISHHQNYCPLCKKPKPTISHDPLSPPVTSSQISPTRHHFSPITTCQSANQLFAASSETSTPYSPSSTHPNLPTSLLCPNCPQLPHAFTIDSRNHLIGQLIHDFKYQSVRALALPLADLLHQTFPKLTGPVVIVPLPTISRHIRERGLDHIYLVAKHFAKLRGSNYHVQKLLTRNQNTVQVGADKTSRTAQAQKAYKLTPNAKINPQATYILLDDVWTTGASMQAAYQTLLSADAFNFPHTNTSSNSISADNPNTDTFNIDALNNGIPNAGTYTVSKIILATLTVSINDPS